MGTKRQSRTLWWFLAWVIKRPERVVALIVLISSLAWVVSMLVYRLTDLARALPEVKLSVF